MWYALSKYYEVNVLTTIYIYVSSTALIGKSHECWVNISEMFFTLFDPVIVYGF